jgi:hypothetical protein
MPRFYCEYTELEEYHAGMWKKVSCEDTQLKMIAEAVSLFRDVAAFEKACLSVITDWRNSCRAAFTTPSLNKIAWLGQAANALVSRVPEDLTRRAWWKLSDAEQLACNFVAGNAYARWKTLETH